MSTHEKLRRRIEIEKPPEPKIIVQEKTVVKYACCSCGTVDAKKFSKSYDYFHRFSRRLCLCDDCIEDFWSIKFNDTKSEKIALYYTCQKLDIPFNSYIYERVLETPTENHMSVSYIRKYNLMRARDNKFGDCFYDSDIFLIDSIFYNKEDIENIEEIQSKKIEDMREEVRQELINDGYNRDEEEYNELIKMYKKDVLKAVGYDPFINDPEEDKPFMYSYLMNLIGEDILVEPYVLQVYINIVRYSSQLEKVTRTVNSLLADPEAMKGDPKTLKELNNVSAQLNTQINNLAKENNLSLKGQKGKGDITRRLTFVMNELQSYD